MITNYLDDPATKLLVEKGLDLLNAPYEPLNFVKDPRIDKFINDLNNYPHFFVLGCVMDRQIKAERAWKIPFFISQEANGQDFANFCTLTFDQINNIFQERKLHRFNKIMANCFYHAIQKINYDYNGDASLIWKENYLCDTVLQRFLQFKGVGIKIATMATNSLIREYKIPLKNKSHIDISPDVHVRRVFTRIGLIEKNSSTDELLYCARSLYPDYPGVFDLPTWQIGRTWCRPDMPDCSSCYITNVCKKHI